jgi:hypothetical protein
MAQRFDGAAARPLEDVLTGAARPWRTIREELPMVSILFVGSAVVSVLAVYTVIGRLVIPPQERVALHRLGWAGWLHTLRRSMVLLGDATPGGRRALLPHATGDGTARAVPPAGGRVTR